MIFITSTLPSHKSLFWCRAMIRRGVLYGVGALALAGLLLAAASPAAAQVSFGSESVSDQTYAVDTGVADLTFPIATGGAAQLA